MGHPVQAHEDCGAGSWQVSEVWQQQAGGELSIERAGEMAARQMTTRAARSMWVMRADGVMNKT
jgi:hypothetical protein